MLGLVGLSNYMFKRKDVIAFRKRKTKKKNSFVFKRLIYKKSIDIYINKKRKI